MRANLEEYAGRQKRFRARVDDFGSGRGGRRETILLVDVRCTDDLSVVATDHAWLKKTKPFQSVAVGDVVEFDAEVERYEKGYVNFRLGIDETTVDFRLCRPANVRIVDVSAG